MYERCLCFGLRANITQEHEDFLLKNYPKMIPYDFIKSLNTDNSHIGGKYQYKLNDKVQY